MVSNPLSGVDVAGIIAQEIGQGLLADSGFNYTLIVRVEGSFDASEPTAGRAITETSVSCKGFIDSQAREDFDTTLVDNGTVMIVLIGNTINGGATVPTTSDHIVAEGTRYTIDRIDRDPAGATYQCMCRPY
jgi:hypothetical protein